MSLGGGGGGENAGLALSVTCVQGGYYIYGAIMLVTACWYYVSTV